MFGSALVDMVVLQKRSSRGTMFALTFDLLNQTAHVTPGASCQHSGAQD